MDGYLFALNIAELPGLPIAKCTEAVSFCTGRYVIIMTELMSRKMLIFAAAVSLIPSNRP
jgi:hypothetical protein